MRLLIFILFSTQIFAQPQKAIKTWYNQIKQTTYAFYEDYVVKKPFLNNKIDTIFFNPTPIDYPDYSSIWYDDALHMTSNKEGWYTGLKKTQRFVLTVRTSIKSKIKPVSLFFATLCFAMAAMDFGERTIFLRILIKLQKSGSTTQLMDINSHQKPMEAPVLCWATPFTVLGELRLTNSQALRVKKTMTSGHLIFQLEGGQTLVKQPSICLHTKQFKKTACFILLATPRTRITTYW